jgi:hypothetical protein
VAALIEVSAVEARMRRTFTDADLTQVEAFIADASALVRDIADGRLDDATPATVPAAIVPVIVKMIRRAIDNPAAIAEEGSDSTYRWRAVEGATDIYATDREEEIIRGAVGLPGIGCVELEGYLPPRLRADDTLFLRSMGDL